MPKITCTVKPLHTPRFNNHTMQTLHTHSIEIGIIFKHLIIVIIIYALLWNLPALIFHNYVNRKIILMCN